MFSLLPPDFSLHASALDILGSAIIIGRDMLQLLSQLSLKIGSLQISVLMVLKAVIAMVLMQLAASWLLGRVERRLARLSSMRPSGRTLTMKLVSILVYFVMFILVAQVAGINLTALSVLGGALGVGLGFGLQKIASNFISGIILLFEKSIEVGDVIEIAPGVNATVQQTYARYTRVETSDGRETLIPNEEFITQRVTTLTHSNRNARIEIKVSVAYDSDIRVVQKLMTDVANRHPLCLPDPAPNCLITEFLESGIGLSLFFWVEDVAAGRLAPRSDVMLGILEAFRAHGITIPYPQRELKVTQASANASEVA